MTREEATIQALRGHIEALNETIEKQNKTIKELKQRSCEDAVSRAEAFEGLNSINGTSELDKAFEVIENLPPVTPTLEQESSWIPVSERLPEEETDVLICNKDGDIALSRGSYSTEVKDDFIWYTSGWRFGKVIAWMPLPKPYKAESEDKHISGKEQKDV